MSAATGADMSAATISEFLADQARAAAKGEAHISFHMPGHKGRTLAFEKTNSGDILRGITACDITEIPGADALFSPSSTIRQVMDNYADLYGVRHTELLVNGSSAGLMAAIMSTVPVGGRLIMGRNSHHSAFSALRLGGINPVYLRPQTDPETGLTGAITPASLAAACEKYPEASAVLITSPNYYGMLSDIRQLADIAHSCGMILIVDQAHGAHLRFFDYVAQQERDEGQFTIRTRLAAESLGADIVVNSTHKTLFSFTGSGILNICSDRVNVDAVSNMLRMLQTTSPSYLLMASLDVNEKMMRNYGISVIEHWKKDLTAFYKAASNINGLRVVTGQDMDLTKINISMADAGLSGAWLDRELRQRGIISEMVHGEYVMLMTGAGNISSDYIKLLGTLRSISDDYGIGCAGTEREKVTKETNHPDRKTVTKEAILCHPDRETMTKEPSLCHNSGIQENNSEDYAYGYNGYKASSYRSSTGRASHPDFVLEVADVPLEGEPVPLYRADGCVLYDPLIIYPPGSPIACPGEIITVEVITYIANAIARGEKVTGVDEEGMIRVARQM